MSAQRLENADSRSMSFRQISDAFLSQDVLLFSEVMTAGKIQHVFGRKGERLVKDDHLIVWTRPVRPGWMDQATCGRIPATLELRELRYSVVEKGRRTKQITVVTTLTDAEMYKHAEIAELDWRHVRLGLLYQETNSTSRTPRGKSKRRLITPNSIHRQIHREEHRGTRRNLCRLRSHWRL
jgi:hypothetical protein